MGSDDGVVWNFPVDVTFKSTNVHGWPRIALSTYGIDSLGRDVVRGYGSALVPLSPGQHVIDVDMYVPLATSTFNQVMSWLMGNPPEVRKLIFSHFINKSITNNTNVCFQILRVFT